MVEVRIYTRDGEYLYDCKSFSDFRDALIYLRDSVNTFNVVRVKLIFS